MRRGFAHPDLLREGEVGREAISTSTARAEAAVECRLRERGVKMVTKRLATTSASMATVSSSAKIIRPSATIFVGNVSPR